MTDGLGWTLPERFHRFEENRRRAIADDGLDPIDEFGALVQSCEMVAPGYEAVCPEDAEFAAALIALRQVTTCPCVLCFDKLLSSFIDMIGVSRAAHLAPGADTPDTPAHAAAAVADAVYSAVSAALNWTEEQDLVGPSRLSEGQLSAYNLVAYAVSALTPSPKVTR